MTSVIIIGSGMGGLAAGIYGQASGLDTTVFESHNAPGGQCTAWHRKGYVFDACIHHLGAGSGRTFVDRLWRELGALPCEMIQSTELVSAVDAAGTWFHHYCDLERLRAHMKSLSPEDASLIDGYVDGISRLARADDPIGALMGGSILRKLSALPALVPELSYFRQTLGSFGARFAHPLLRKAIPLLHSSVPEAPVAGQMLKHAYVLGGDLAWPRGGSLEMASRMAARYVGLGGALRLRSRVTRILTERNRACGVQLADGSRHLADYVISNADGRKTILELLEGRYLSDKIARSCKTDSDRERAFAVQVFLGVDRDLSTYPSDLIVFADKPHTIAGHTADHLHLQIYGFDSSMAPPGKGVIKVELFSRESYFAPMYDDETAYTAEKSRIAEQVIALLEPRFPGLRQDVEVTDVCTLRTWERYMGGTGGFDNFRHDAGPADMMGAFLGRTANATLPGLADFYFVGGWATSAAALNLNALSGRSAIMTICRHRGLEFKTPS